MPRARPVREFVVSRPPRGRPPQGGRGGGGRGGAERKDRPERPDRAARPDRREERPREERPPTRDRAARPAPPNREDRGPAGDRPRSAPAARPPREERGGSAFAARRPAVAPEPLPPVRGDRLEGRNVVEEALLRKRRRVHRIWLDAAARLDEKLAGVLEMAAAAGVVVETVDRARLDRMSLTGVHNGIIAEAEGLPQPTVKEAIAAAGFDGFFILVDEVQYEHNLGAVLRSALGAGVTAVIIPTERGKGLTPVVSRVSMGGAEAVPVIREGLSSALAQLQRAGVRILAADMDGVPPWGLDMTGPVALVLGGEDKGVSDALKKRADAIVGIPLAGGLQSLNVSVSAAVLMFERVRQLAVAKG